MTADEIKIQRWIARLEAAERETKVARRNFEGTSSWRVFKRTKLHKKWGSALDNWERVIDNYPTINDEA